MKELEQKTTAHLGRLDSLVDGRHRKPKISVLLQISTIKWKELKLSGWLYKLLSKVVLAAGLTQTASFFRNAAVDNGNYIGSPARSARQVPLLREDILVVSSKPHQIAQRDFGVCFMCV